MGKDRKKDKKDKKSKKDKKDKKERKKERREHKKEEEDEWVVAPLADAVAPLPPTEEPTDDFLLRTPPRSSNDDAAPDEDALPTHNAPSQREDAGLSWMLRPPPRAAPRPVPERPASPPPEETKPKPRELNPYFADGGSGLPSDERRRRAEYTVGDGGNSWRARAERRARERALEEGTSPDAPAPTVDFEAISRRDSYSGGSGRSDRGRGGWRKRTDGNGGGAEDERDSRRDDNGDDGHRYRRRDDEREQRPREDRERGRTDDRGGRGSRREEDEGHTFLSRKRELPPAREEESARHPPEDRMDEVANAGSMPPPPAPAVLAPVPQVSEEEANKLQAQLLKAELMGDQDRIRELKAKLAQIREAQKVVVLSGLDQRGRPINRPAGDNLDEARRMMAAERECDTRSANLDFARSLARHQAYSDEDFGEVHFDQTRSKKRRRTGAPERTAEDMQRARAIAGETQDQRMRENCTYCLDEGKRVGKHLLISMGQKAYLCLPHRGSLVPGHCFIVPHGHVGACTALETDVFQEIVEFQRALVRMFAQQDKVVLFFETGAVGKRTKHMVLQCVPMDKRDAAVAPGYFKKTLSDAGSEWGQHRKIIDTTGRGVRRAIPKEFPYFHVQFPDGTSFGHVIEDVKDFPKDLGKEVIAGVLELDPESVRGAHENFDAQRSRAQAFQRSWRPFDPTRAPQHPAGASGATAAGPAAASSGGPP